MAVDAVIMSQLLWAHMCQAKLMICLSRLYTAWFMIPG